MRKPVADLAEGFDTPSLGDWQKAAEKALKGRTVSTLTVKTEDALAVAPLYISSSEDFQVLAPGNSDFVLRPRIDIPDIGAARVQMLEDIENGCGGFIVTAQGATAQSFGILLKTADDAKRLIEGLPVEKLTLRLDAGNNIALAKVFLEAGFARVHPGFDILGRAAASGIFPELKSEFESVLAMLDKSKPEGAAFVVDGRFYHNAGASDAQELGLALATATENLRQMDNLGIQQSSALRRMSLLLSSDARQFASIIKLRAMRLLWARFSEAVSGTAQSIHLSVETSARMLSAKDAHTNLVRNTLAAFAAIIGGAEKITVLPHTSALGLPDGFARRLARNTLNILREESHLALVQDAARGSAYVEEMTLQLAQAAWQIFQDIEMQGGMFASLKSGSIQKLIVEKREARMKAYREGERIMVGVNAFADMSERDAAILQKMPVAEAGNPLALKVFRDSAVFEANGQKDAAA